MEKPDGPALSNGRVKRGSSVGVTPNASWASASGVRPLSGMLSICRVVITWPVEAVVVVSMGASALTETVSVMAPSVISTSRPTRSLALSEMPVRSYFLKPGASAVTR